MTYILLETGMKLQKNDEVLTFDDWEPIEDFLIGHDYNEDFKIIRRYVDDG